jgi:hypothetical protein
MLRCGQAKALLLLLVFLAAGTSLPSLDALVHHGKASEETRSQSHIEPAGGCASHSGHCALGRGAPGSGAGAGDSRESRFSTAAGSLSHLPQSQAPLSSTHVGIPQSRAPPVLFA